MQLKSISTVLILASLPYQYQAAVSVVKSSSRNENALDVKSYVHHEKIRKLSGDTEDDRLDDVGKTIFTMSQANTNTSDSHSDEDHSDEDHSDEDHSDEGHSDEDGHDSHEDHSSHDSHDEGERKRPYGTVLLATFLVNVATLVGVLTFVPFMIKKRGHCFNATFWATEDSETDDPEEDYENHPKIKVSTEQTTEPKGNKLLNIFVPSFACGALLATSFFLVIPEALAFIQNAVSKNQDDEEGHEEHEDHAEEGMEILPGTIVRFATSILAGYMLPLVIGVIFPKPGAPSKLGTTSNLRLAGSILIGDAAHNFCDGIFIGVAFMTCSKSIAWSIVGVTIYHEVAQEIADFFLLTKHAGLSVAKALLLNFVAGLSVVIGGLIILGLDISDMAIGVILSFSGGVYVYIAASECLPRVDAVVKDGKDKIYSILFFLLGAIPIGLTLLNHEHCG